MGRPELHLTRDAILRGAEHLDGAAGGCILAHLGMVSGIATPPHTVWFRKMFWDRVMLPTLQVPRHYHVELRERVFKELLRIEVAASLDLEDYIHTSHRALVMLGIRFTVNGRVPTRPRSGSVLPFIPEPRTQ